MIFYVKHVGVGGGGLNWKCISIQDVHHQRHCHNHYHHQTSPRSVLLVPFSYCRTIESLAEELQGQIAELSARVDGLQEENASLQQQLDALKDIKSKNKKAITIPSDPNISTSSPILHAFLKYNVIL